MGTVLPPQPPPDAPAPPPGPEAERSQRKIRWILRIGIGCALLLILAGLSDPFRPPPRHGANRTEAMTNLRQVHLALFDFDADYGAFPDASTIPAVQAKTSTTLALGNRSSNELFRQLLTTGISTSESIFWARCAANPRKPDDLLGPHALEKGECAFAYIAGLSSSSDTTAPVAMAPLIPGTWEFDPKPFDGKAVVLRIDGSVKTETIDKHGHVMIRGMNLLDPRQPYWRGKTPDIKWPDW